MANQQVKKANNLCPELQESKEWTSLPRHLGSPLILGEPADPHAPPVHGSAPIDDHHSKVGEQFLGADVQMRVSQGGDADHVGLPNLAQKV